MKRLHRFFVIGVILLLASVSGPGASLAQREQLPPWRKPMPAALKTAEITVGDVPVIAELALSLDEQSLGLGYRNGLEPGRGMLFVFQEPSELGFWMKGMRFCLDIIWIAQGEIVGAVENACPDPEGTEDADRATFRSEEPVSHVLAMPAGWLAENALGAGTAVEIPEPLA